ncbi:hypothetical protein K461DRAFT_41320 [Myriangium duriaei CBS 260.36]|uniref:Uncharacterized protein n=1 Tax=Myriangium duriaei CBS 260.36 TaxID=1168546 RepID=A0A9P4IX73_9PEZI|nr:hypothetical protein K461DRAFT_41320 [Myriangium duriaei CBS 260.36]
MKLSTLIVAFAGTVMADTWTGFDECACNRLGVNPNDIVHPATSSQTSFNTKSNTVGVQSVALAQLTTATTQDGTFWNTFGCPDAASLGYISGAGPLCFVEVLGIMLSRAILDLYQKPSPPGPPCYANIQLLNNTGQVNGSNKYVGENEGQTACTVNTATPGGTFIDPYPSTWSSPTSFGLLQGYWNHMLNLKVTCKGAGGVSTIIPADLNATTTAVANQMLNNNWPAWRGAFYETATNKVYGRCRVTINRIADQGTLGLSMFPDFIGVGGNKTVAQDQKGIENCGNYACSWA